MSKFKANEVCALLRRLKSIARGVCGVSVNVKQIPKGSNDIGYATSSREIFLNFEHEYCAGLSKAKLVSFLRGVFAHEIMHILLSKFKNNPYKKNSEARIFQMLNNILEDSYIEAAAEGILSGELIRDLDFSRATINKCTDPIDAATTPFHQFINAIIQFGDVGLIKGTWSFPEARKAFVDALPYLDGVIREPDPDKRFQMARDLTEQTRPLWEEEAKKQEAFEELLRKLQKNRFGKDVSGGGISGSPLESLEEPAPDSSARASRRRVTIEIVTREEYEEAKKKETENIPDEGDITILVPEDGILDENRETGGSAVEVPLPLSAEDSDDSSSDKNTTATGGPSKSKSPNESSVSEESTSAGKGFTSKGDSSEDRPDADTDSSSKKGSASEKDNSAEDEEGSDADVTSDDDFDDDDGFDDDDDFDGDDDLDGDDDFDSEMGNGEADGETERNCTKKCGSLNENSPSRDADDSSGDSSSSSAKSDHSSDSESSSRGRTTPAEASEGSGHPSSSEDSAASSSDSSDSSEENSPEGNTSVEDLNAALDRALESLESELNLSKKDLSELLEELKSLPEPEEKEDDDFDVTVSNGYKGVCKGKRNLSEKATSQGPQEEYNAILSLLGSKPRNFASTLERLFRSDQADTAYRTSGKLSIPRYSSGRLTANVFEKRRAPSDSDVYVMILVDESGSMISDNKYYAAKTAAIGFAEAFAICKVPMSIIGFTADERGYDAIHYHYINGKNTAETRRRLLNISARSNNFDGYSIRYAAELLKKRPESHKILFVVSDGTPAARAYNGREHGVTDTALAIKEASKNATVFGVLLGNGNPKAHRAMYGYNFVHCSNINKLFSELAKLMKKEIKKW